MAACRKRDVLAWVLNPNNANRKIMKNASRVIVLLGSALILASSGCATNDVRHVRRSAAIDPAPGDQAKGYVEFHGRSGKGVVAIYLVDEPSLPLPLAATGLRADELYSGRRHPTVVAEKLRVAVASGSHTFMIQR